MLLPLLMGGMKKNAGANPQDMLLSMLSKGGKNDPMTAMLLSMLTKKRPEAPACNEPPAFRPIGCGLAPIKSFCPFEVLHVIRYFFDKK